MKELERDIRLRVLVPPGDSGRAVAWEVGRACGVSREAAEILVTSGGVRIDGVVCRDPNRPVTGRQRLEVQWRAASMAAFELARIVHAEPSLVVLEKPAGIPVLSTTEGGGSSLDEFVRRRIPGARPAFVHRIDLPVSGLVLAALNRRGAAALATAFEAKRVRKVYMALVEPTDAGERFLAGERGMELEIATPLVWLSGKRRAVVDPGGRRALSILRLIETFEPKSDWCPQEILQSRQICLVGVRLVTGRTHQARAHLASVGLPICGDALYGPQSSRCASARGEKLKAASSFTAVGPSTSRGRRSLRRICLHACLLSFPHPESGEMLEFFSWPGEDFWTTAALPPPCEETWIRRVKTLLP